MQTQIITKNLDAIAELAAKMVVESLGKAITTHGTATWVIAGGTSPMAAYRILTEKYLDVIDWSKVQFIIGDERITSFDHSDSNWTQVEGAFLRHIASPASSIGRPATESNTEKAAAQYQAALMCLPQTKLNIPRFDHVWLGLGEDGHTLSLFPGHASLDPTDQLVIPVHDSPKPPSNRISLSLSALRGTSTCLILAGGANKAAVIARALSGDMALPITRAAHEIERAGGSVIWLLDEDTQHICRSEPCVTQPVTLDKDVRVKRIIQVSVDLL